MEGSLNCYIDAAVQETVVLLMLPLQSKPGNR